MNAIEHVTHTADTTRIKPPRRRSFDCLFIFVPTAGAEMWPSSLKDKRTNGPLGTHERQFLGESPYKFMSQCVEGVRIIQLDQSRLPISIPSQSDHFTRPGLSQEGRQLGACRDGEQVSGVSGRTRRNRFSRYGVARLTLGAFSPSWGN